MAADSLPVQHPTREGKVYCAVVLDAFSRRMVGWSIDSTQNAGLVTSVLDMSIRNRRPSPDLVIHSDHGVQFTSWAFTEAKALLDAARRDYALS